MNGFIKSVGVFVGLFGFAVSAGFAEETFTDAQVDQPPPVISSQPPPFTIPDDAPAASNSPNFFNGFAGVQDFSRFTPGNFEGTKYKWYGFVRLDAIFDGRPIGSTDDFVTSSIPVPQGVGRNAVLTPRYTRLGFDTETDVESMDWKVKTRIEMDFFNGNKSGAFGSFPLRLRFAWVDFGPFLIGQAASLFMDYDVFPNVLDYEGPPGMVLVRQPIAAVRLYESDQFRVIVGAEQPYSDIQWFDGGAWVVNPGSGIITTPNTARNVQSLPDFTGNVRWNWLYGHTQISGIGRQLTYQNAANVRDNQFGYGINFTGTWHPWAHLHGCEMCDDYKTPMEKSRILYQYAAGNGINRYIQDVNGLGLDATFDPVNGFLPISSNGWFVAYEQWWADNWASVATYGETHSALTPALPANTYQGATYASANLIYFPVPRMGVGMEYLYGTRVNKDGQSGIGQRFQMAFQYKF